MKVYTKSERSFTNNVLIEATREPHSSLRQLVNVRSPDLGAIAANVRIPQVVGEDDKEVWSFAGHGGIVVLLTY